MDILCSYKTGTITKNKLTLQGIIQLGSHSKEEILLMADLASKKEDMDPIDDAIMKRVEETEGLIKKAAGYRTIDFRPFDPVSKKIEAMVQAKNGKRITIAKGAPQAILRLKHNEQELGKKIGAILEDNAARGFRTIGIATKEKSEWEYIGLIAFYDPPRNDSEKTIRTAGELNVEVKMVTGDHVAIAREI